LHGHGLSVRTLHSADGKRRVEGETMKRFEVGTRVLEPTYGLGSVIAVEDQYTRVQFDEHGVKKFLTSLSRLEPTGESVTIGKGGVIKRRRTKAAKAAPVIAPPEEPAEDDE
jgi:hypothetical protein